MSGYLAAIAARVSGGRPMLAPRPQARFEAEPPSGGALPELEVEHAPSPPVSRRVAAPPGPPVPQQPVKPSMPTTPGDVPPAVVAATVPVARPAPPVVTPSIRAPDAAARTRPALPQHAVPGQAATQPPLRDTKQLAATLPAQPRRVDAPASHPATGLPALLRAVLQGGQGQSATQPRTPSSPGRSGTATPGPSQASRAARVAGLDAAPAVPVSVTIGRVDIRATLRAPQPATPARPAAPDPAGLNLDAYLRRRDGGSG